MTEGPIKDRSRSFVAKVDIQRRHLGHLCIKSSSLLMIITRSPFHRIIMIIDDEQDHCKIITMTWHLAPVIVPDKALAVHIKLVILKMHLRKNDGGIHTMGMIMTK